MENHVSKKILTVSIPTWNRASLLKDLLFELTAQISSFNLQREIEILVSDNASEDDTKAVVELFQGKFSFIKYNRNPTNLGAKSNVLKSMELASSEFVMVLGDDDRVRKNVFPELLEILKTKKDLGVFIDISNAKIKIENEFTLPELLKNYYWYIGNAGIFAVRAAFIKENLSRYGYDFFNECWPQTQLMVLGLFQNKNLSAYSGNLGLLNESLHDEVMVYNSYYLWRTCYYDLTISINSLQNLVTKEIIDAAKTYLKKNIVQQLFNILQCGVFVDDAQTRKKTRVHILRHLSLFSSYEKIVLFIIIVALALPVSVSKPISNLFIFLTKGNKGIKKKNEFVKSEIFKKIKNKNSKAIRKLEFEK